jgi:hypothetical protein
MTETLHQYAHSHNRYELLDGTSEIVLGLAFLFFSAGFWLSSKLTVTWQWFACWFAGLGMLWALSNVAVPYIRRKLVYPRSGYLKQRSRPWKPVLLMLSACILAVATTLFFSGIRNSLIPLMTSLALGAAFLGAALVKGVKKFIIYAALSVGIGLLNQFNEPTFRAGLMRYYLLMGAALLIAGSWTLYSYVRHMPPQSMEAE